MPRLSIFLLGPLRVTLDGEPVTGFESDKVRALLAYLAVESEAPQRRERLAGLLWPEQAEQSARTNLRHVLANLRSAIGDRASSPLFLHISRQTIQFNRSSDAWVDVSAFTELLQANQPANQTTVHQLEEAVDLYRGTFLAGFSLAGCPAFEEWALLEGERLQRLALEALGRLSDGYEAQGNAERALEYTWRQVELEPWREEAQRQVMRLLALGGQRGAALAQYETCRRILVEELGVEPGAKTRQLYEQIRDGEVEMPIAASALKWAPEPVARQPGFLAEGVEEVQPPPFVARERELARLEGFLERALAGQGRVVFVTGDPGRGKTALLAEFARRAMEVQPDLLVASGNCNAYSGIGDPYLPFRDVLAMLTGDVEAKWASGSLTRDHTLRLWDSLPLAVQALLDHSPHVVPALVPGAALLSRALAVAPIGAPWLQRLKERIEQRPAGSEGLEQSHLFQQISNLLRALAKVHPLLLILDDLQWADSSSIGLLFHLARRLEGSRILIAVAYRPEEVASGRNGAEAGDRARSLDRGRHPLEKVLAELKRQFGDVWVDLAETEEREGRHFVDALLESEPNRLGENFRRALFEHAGGHPLFTVELLRAMQERGDLVQDEYGRWVPGPALDWEMLPPRVEGVIETRVGRLDEDLRDFLSVASVEGEVFTAEVVARVRSANEGEVVGRLSRELDRRHRLVQAQGIQRLEGRRLSRFRFRHILFQRYLYNSLDEVERVHLHEAVGNMLETLYGGQAEAPATTAATEAIAGQLAWHFQEAGLAEKAAGYLRQAGERAMRLSAHKEAIAHLERGLELLAALPDPAAEGGQGTPDVRSERARQELARQELALQLALGMAWIAEGTVVPEVEKAFTRARELGEQTGQVSQLCQVLGELAVLYYVGTEYGKARESAEEALSLAQGTGEPLLVAHAHWILGFVLFGIGEFKAALAHLQQMISFYKAQQHHRLLLFYRRSDAGLSALSYAACCLWCLGYPEQAMQRSQEVIALARELGHAFSLADALSYAACLLNALRRDARALKDSAEELVRVSSEGGFRGWHSFGMCFRGEALAMLGQVEEGMAQMREGLAARGSQGMRCYEAGTLCTLAGAQAEAGHPEEGLATLDQALARVEETGEHFWEAELHRVRAELLLMEGDEAGAEASLLKAVEVAHCQSARSWELRATTDLARLWQAQGREEEARQALAGIYGWFSEGFETRDLKEAEALLGELSPPQT